MKTSIPVAGLGALLLAAGTVSCGGTGSSQEAAITPAAAVAKAAKNTEDIATFTYRMTGTTPQTGKIKGQGVIRLEPAIAMSMKMQATDGPAAQAGQIEFRLVSEAMYVGGSPEMAKEMDGKSWLKFDLSGSAASKELDKLGSPSQPQQNPAAESTFITGARNVTKIGTENVDGIRTTHYRGTVGLTDLRDSLKNSDAKTRKQREQSIEQYEGMGVDKLDMDIWIDGDDRTRRFRTQGDTDRGPLDMTITFLGFDVPVHITAPSDKDTFDLSDTYKGPRTS